MGADGGSGALPEGQPSLSSVAFDAVFEASPVTMMVTSLADGRYLHVNAAFERMTGWPREEVIGKTSLEVAQWVDPEERAQMVAAVRENGFVANRNGRFVHRDGEERTGVFSAQVIDVDGQPCLLVVASNVDERIAEELRRSEERYRNLVERVPAVTYIWDARWEPGEAPAQYVSPQIERLLGFTLEEWQADPRIWHEQVHPDDLGWILDEWARAEEEKAPFLVEYRMHTKDGRELWVRDEARQIASSEEDARQWQGVMIDITDRKLAEDALAESEARLRVLVSNVPGVMWTTDRDLVVTSSEGGVLSKLGLMPGQLVGVSLAAFLQNEDPDYLPMRMHREALEGRSNSWELDFAGLSWTSHVEPLMDDAGAVIGTIGISIDVTEQRRAEDELRAYSERLSTLYDIAAAILSARSSSDIAREALGHIRTLAGCERASVVEYRMEPEEAFWLAVDSSIETSVGEGRVADRNLWGDVSSFERGETRIVNDLTVETSWSPSTEALVDEGIRSHLTIPLVAEGVLIGTLNLGSTEPGHFTDEHLDTAQQVAGQLAVALHQARLHERVEHSADELERRLEDLRRADGQRRQLLARVVRAQEEERQRIASDIHDDSIQKMAAVGLRLESLRRRFAEDAEARGQVDQIEETVKVSIERLRHLMFELWPPALERHGLADAVRTELDQTKATSGLDYVLSDELETEPPPETRTVAYRIIQEAVSNIRKHAEASTVEVTLANRDGGIDVKVSDDGRGIEETPTSPPGHLGLSAMHERAEMAGGWVRINGRSGRGTTVEFWLPGEIPASS
ncbi:MAG: PAS domain S-box protein [Actinomycetota bacterium]